MWTALIAPVADLVKTWLDNRKKKANAKHEKELQLIANTASWEQLMAEASSSSWKDELFTILLSIPLVAVGWGVFTDDPEIIERVGIGFEHFALLPTWYQYLLGVAVTASFGIRGADKVIGLMKK